MIFDESLLFIGKGFDPITFTADGTWTVPAGIRRVRVDCVASQGCSYTTSIVGGYGGRVQCILNVSGVDTLYISVGPVPTSLSANIYNASDIRIGGVDKSNRVLVAGGGGSASWVKRQSVTAIGGGPGGSTTGGNGFNAIVWGYGATIATGGSQTAGGTGSTASVPYTTAQVGGTGTFGTGGAGASSSSGAGGAGGAGWYGGGGGAVNHFADEKTIARVVASGGGGSSYTDPSLCSEVVHTQGYRAGSGYVTISMV